MFYLLNVETNKYTTHTTREAAQARQDPKLHVLIADGSTQAVAIDFAEPDTSAALLDCMRDVPGTVYPPDLQKRLHDH